MWMGWVTYLQGGIIPCLSTMDVPRLRRDEPRLRPQKTSQPEMADGELDPSVPAPLRDLAVVGDR